MPQNVPETWFMWNRVHPLFAVVIFQTQTGFRAKNSSAPVFAQLVRTTFKHFANKIDPLTI